MLKWLHRILFSSIVLDYEIRLNSAEVRSELLQSENAELRSKLMGYFDDHRRVADWLCVTPHEACRPIFNTIEGWKPEDMLAPRPASASAESIRPSAPSTLREAGERQEQDLIEKYDLETRSERARRLQREAQAADQSVLASEAPPPN